MIAETQSKKVWGAYTNIPWSSHGGDIKGNRGSFVFKFDQDIAFDDDEINFTDFSVVLDSLSYPYLYGSTLDFVEDLSGSKFVINNPNAKTTCGCGESFSI